MSSNKESYLPAELAARALEVGFRAHGLILQAIPLRASALHLGPDSPAAAARAGVPGVLRATRTWPREPARNHLKRFAVRPYGTGSCGWRLRG